MTDARGFAPFPAQRGRSTRGRSWWARAWTQALEDTSLDHDQLRQGRRGANSGQVGPITVSPGRIAAPVHAPGDTYDAVVLVDRLGPEQWRRFLDQVAGRAGHIAALLDGDMPRDLVATADDVGVSLLPGIGDLDPSCTCDAWELPCQHAASLCYQVAWLLDSDPFVLLLARGRSRESLLDDLQQRLAVPVTAAQAGMSGLVGPDVARDAGTDGVPGRIGVEELAVSGIPPLDGVALPLLALDAARRARAELAALLADRTAPWRLDRWQDAVRLAADHPELATRLAEATGRPDDLRAGIEAWSYGGAPALDVLEHTWSPDPGDLARARTELRATADSDLDITTDANHLTLTGPDRTLQLRLDHLGRWHPYRSTPDGWHPSGPPHRDPTAALADGT